MLFSIFSSHFVLFLMYSLRTGAANVVTAIVITIVARETAIFITPFFIPMSANMHKTTNTAINTIIIFSVSISYTYHYNAIKVKKPFVPVRKTLRLLYSTIIST